MEHMKASGFDTWNHEGIELPIFVNKEVLLGDLKNFEVFDDDIWLCTYPKSGTHWTMQILSLLKCDGDLNKLNAYIEANLQPPGPIEHSLSLPDGTVKHSYKYFEKLPSPRMILTHLSLKLLPTQVFEKKVKVIYVVRNPKDVAVSSYHFVKPVKEAAGLDLHWHDFIETHMSEKASRGPWSSHVLPFWKRRHDDNVLFLKFEDMKANPLVAVTEIATFVGKTTSEDVLKRTVENSSVKKTKEVMDSSHHRSGAASALNVGAFVRKGIVGDWKTQFTVAQSQAYDALLEKDLKGSGLVMQYE